MNLSGGIDGLLALRQGAANYQYLYDGKGNTTVLDTTNPPVASYHYDVFGKLLRQSGTLDQPYTFSTKRYFAALGLNYYGYRFYQPAVGRWLTRDPLQKAGGLNLYGFVLNNPVNKIAPYGLSGWDTLFRFVSKRIGKKIGKEIIKVDDGELAEDFFQVLNSVV